MGAENKALMIIKLPARDVGIVYAERANMHRCQHRF